MGLINRLRNYYLRQFFFPDIFSIVVNLFYLVRKGMPEKIAEYASGFNGRMLGFGCGHKPYKSLFPHGGKVHRC